MNKILVPFDFSEIATNALEFAVQLSKRDDQCSVTVLNVIEHPSASSFKTMGVSDFDPMEDIYMKKLVQTVEGKLNEALTKDHYGNT